MTRLLEDDDAREVLRDGEVLRSDNRQRRRIAARRLATSTCARHAMTVGRVARRLAATERPSP